jgi:hypothetical protein
MNKHDRLNDRDHHELQGKPNIQRSTSNIEHPDADAQSLRAIVSLGRLRWLRNGWSENWDEHQRGDGNDEVKRIGDASKTGGRRMHGNQDGVERCDSKARDDKPDHRVIRPPGQTRINESTRDASNDGGARNGKPVEVIEALVELASQHERGEIGQQCRNEAGDQAGQDASAQRGARSILFVHFVWLRSHAECEMSRL